MKNIIFHIDVNSAFLSWEAVYRLAHKGEKQDLREVVSAVGGDAALRRGIILAKSIPAKSYGIKTGETILEAQRKCRELVLVPPNYRLYEKCSGAFMEILQKYSDAVEPYSIDEAFVDMSTSCRLFGTPEETAEQIKDHIRKELGFTVNVGVYSNKLLAKMASDFQKPDRVHTLYPEEIQKKMWPLPVSDLFFVGRAAAGRLFSVGIRTIGELAKADPAWLKSMLKKQGELIWGFANGIDLSPVLENPAGNKGYGNSTTTPFDVADEETADRVLLALCELVGGRLRADRVQVCVVSVGVRYTDFVYVSHQKKLQSPTNLTLELYGAARRLFRELWNQRPVRHLGVHTSGVSGSDTGRQLSIFDEIDYEKLGRMDQTVDGIRKRFGEDAVRRAVFLEQPADDRNGGRGDGIWNWYKPAGSGRGQCQGNTGENCL
ncbi:MAG: DNA polymerase IV [Lachnospiraceae bacterium]|nr:DNA polymerase IV [Lachnospiraceae bacterium]